MLKICLIAASLLMLGASGAVAQQDMPGHNGQDSYGRFSGPDSPEAFGGVNQFCGPGEIPEPFPSGNGVRCALQNGGYRY